MDANFAAAQAVHDMQLQSWGNVVRILPAIPIEWPDVSFPAKEPANQIEVDYVLSSVLARNPEKITDPSKGPVIFQ